jgi:tetratricopeptide (TPR) repeat protein
MREGALTVAETLKTTSTDTWSGAQAAALVLVCLLAGTAGGWLIRRSSPAPAAPQTETAPAPAAVASPPAPANFGLESATPSAEQLKAAADSQAAPILEKLKTDPNNAGLLASVGNLYYDAKLYPTAIDYYERSLKVQPANTSVRTDLGTAYWYTGNADTAIAQFNKSLSYDPTKADTLFNLGIVKWQGKKDGPGAIAAWKKLLDTNPTYPNKDAVVQLMAQAQQK